MWAFASFRLFHLAILCLWPTNNHIPPQFLINLTCVFSVYERYIFKGRKLYFFSFFVIPFPSIQFTQTWLYQSEEQTTEDGSPSIKL